MILFILLATILSGVVSLVGAFALARSGKWEKTFSLQLTAFAAGVMLTTALLHLLPESLHDFANEQFAFWSTFVGIILFFVLERLVFWFHHHHDSHGEKPSAWLITIGDTVHNFVDGVAIASAFLVDIRLGILTAVAVGLHEIPQEIADFVVMIRGGFTAKKAILFNIFSSLSSIVGGVLMYVLRDSLDGAIPFILAFSAGMFLYIALSDLIPDLHEHESTGSQKWTQLAWFFAGIVLMFGVTTVVESAIPHSEKHEEEMHEELEDHEEEGIMHLDEEVHLE